MIYTTGYYILSVGSMVSVLLLFQAKPPVKPDPPRVTMVWPWVVNPVGKHKLILRGQNLDAVQSAQLETTGMPMALSLEGKVASAPLPDGMDGKLFGSQILTLETGILAGTPVGDKQIVLTGKNQEKAKAVVEVTTSPLTPEKEPNNDLDQAQEISKLPCRLLGTIEKKQDVDCFRIDLKQGQTVEVRLTSRGRGSVLDPLITIQAPDGSIRQKAVPKPGAMDLVLIHTAKNAGPVCIVVQDSFDSGSQSHAYDALISIIK